MKITIEKEISSCMECPYFHTESNMGARMFVCANIGIIDVRNYTDVSDRIYYNQCPFKESEKR